MPRTYGTTNASPNASVPAVGASGDMYYDTTTKTLYISDGTAWGLCVGAGTITANEIGLLAVGTTKINANAVIMNKIVAAGASPATIGRIASGAGNFAEISGAPVIICTSSTRPASPVAGMTIFETDTYKTLQYTTATTGWQLPWSQPWGEMAFAQVTAAQTGLSTTVDLTGLSVTFTAVANRKIITTLWIGQWQNITTAGQSSMWIADGANNPKAIASFQTDAVPTMAQLIAQARETTTAGSITRKGRGSATAGTISITGSATQPNFILIEDLGPSANPA